MAIKIVFDASVLVSGNVSGNIHKTGLYRVSYEMLKEIVKSNEFELYLFDIFHRERELIRYVQYEFPQCKRIRVHGLWYRLLIFPLGNLADNLRNAQKSKINKAISLVAGLLKNGLLLIEKAAKKIERLFIIEKNLNDSLNQCEVYYSTYFPIPDQVRMNSKIKKVYTLHDMIPIIHPEYFSSPFNQKLLKEVVDNIRVEDYIICVSESTKNDLLKYRPELNSSRLVVALLAASEYFYRVTDKEKINNIKGKYLIPLEKNYLLSVCTLEPRKNLKTVIASYRNILQEGKVRDLALVLTGSPGWESDVLIDEINELNERYNNSIVMTGFVTDNDLAVLYSGSFTFIYLSLYEGFGLPVLEAMQCGVPVISSNTSSLPEVVGDCGIMIDPSSITELEGAILLLYNDKFYREQLKQNSKSRADLFKWSKTASIVSNVFNCVLLKHE